MTKAEFLLSGGSVSGFFLSGHSTECAEDDEGRVLCAAVSSAAYMTANTITEIIGDSADITVSDGEMSLKVSSPSDKTRAVLDGFRLHLSELSKQYGKRLTITEV